MIVGLGGVCEWKYWDSIGGIENNPDSEYHDLCEYTDEAECISDGLCDWIPHGMIYQC